MSTTQHAPDTETSAEAPTRHQPKLLELSLTQLIGGALAAATAAYLGSRLGLAGTITGAVVASLASALAAAVYTASLRHGRDRVKALPRRPRTIAISAVATLIAALAIITVVEKVSGHALSGGGPTTVQQLGGDTAGKRPDTTPAPATTATTTVSPSPTVTVTVTATPSPPDSTTPTPTPTDTATPTPSPTPSPTGTASPSS